MKWLGWRWGRRNYIKVGEHARRGDISALTDSLHKAYDSGKINSSSNTLKFFCNIADNMRKESNGRRQNTFSEKFYKVLRIWGGKRLSNFVAGNLFGPSDSAQKRTRQKQINRHRQEGMTSTGFSWLAKVYKDLKENCGIDGPVLAEASEDELWGFCGSNDGHMCSSDHVVKVGTGEDGYHNIKEAFQNNKIASYARVIMINPLHWDLPALVALLTPTCNTFDHTYAEQQWQKLEDLYDEHLLPVLGPLISHASDGDARRRKSMLSRAFCQPNQQAYTI